MAQSMTMFSKAATASFTSARTTKAQRRGAVAVRAGPYDAELVETAVSIRGMRGGGAGDPRILMPAYPLAVGGIFLPPMAN